jgi:hypothetical protein
MAKKRIGKLATCEDIGLEMRRIYRQARREELDVNIAKSLIYILSMIVAVRRDTDIEERLEALEDMA